MGRLVLVRHAQAEGNSEHRFIGQTDVPLTALGRRQAEAVGLRLRTANIARVISSDLSRTADTAAAIAAVSGTPVEFEPAIREIHNGEWAGLTPEEIARGWSDMWNRYRGGEDVPRPGGERWADVRARTLVVLERLLELDGVSVVVSHGGPIVIGAHWATGHIVDGNVFRGRLGAVQNTALTVIDHGPKLTAFNDVGHLAAFADFEVPDAPV
ncbi:MAG: histidine phosphatase family protein [Acidimicrobiia bacterium]